MRVTDFAKVVLVALLAAGCMARLLQGITIEELLLWALAFVTLLLALYGDADVETGAVGWWRGRAFCDGSRRSLRWGGPPGRDLRGVRRDVRFLFRARSRRGSLNA